jgi:DNA-binding GntR family transcriptional regulator
LTNRFPQLKAVSIRESVGEVVREALYQHRFQAGEALSEAALAAEMGISRGPVREALLVLVQEGLLTHSPNRGFAVVNFTQDDLNEINEVRLPLEALALTLAKSKISEADLEKLSALKRKMVKSYTAGEIIGCGHSDMAFHSLIWERTGNSRLASTLRTLLAPFFAYGSLFNVGREGLTPRLLDEEHEYFIGFLGGVGKWNAEACVRFHLGLELT